MGNLIDLATKADQIPIEEFVQRTSRFAIVVTKCVWCVVCGGRNVLLRVVVVT